MSLHEAMSFLRALKEDGIEQVHVSKKKEPSISAPCPRNSVREEHGSDSDLSDLRAKAEQCQLCPELAKTRHKVVFGSGSPHAKLVFVGEAPGADEDLQGLPFVGRAGQLLTKIIEAMGLTRDQVYICNVLKCRPPGNRQPAPKEVENCRPYLKRQLELIKPRVVVALGNHAVRALLQIEGGITGLRGTFQKYEGIPVMCTYHPAYLLRSPGEKRKVWEDMKKVMKFLKEAGE
jgi:DNA polymerase